MIKSRYQKSCLSIQQLNNFEFFRKTNQGRISSDNIHDLIVTIYHCESQYELGSS